MVERGYCIYSISLNILTYFLPLNNYLVTLFHNTICRAQLFCRFLLSASEYLSNMLFSYHLLYFCTALSLIIMLSSHYHHHKSKTFSQLTQCPFTGTLLLLDESGGLGSSRKRSYSQSSDGLDPDLEQGEICSKEDDSTAYTDTLETIKKWQDLEVKNVECFVPRSVFSSRDQVKKSVQQSMVFGSTFGRIVEI